MRASEITFVSRDSFRDHGSGIQLLRTLELSKDCEHSEDEFISTGTLKEIENQSESWWGELALKRIACFISILHPLWKPSKHLSQLWPLRHPFVIRSIIRGKEVTEYKPALYLQSRDFFDQGTLTIQWENQSVLHLGKQDIYMENPHETGFRPSSLYWILFKWLLVLNISFE